MKLLANASRLQHPSVSLQDGLQQISALELSEALARTPLTQYVLWNGLPAAGRDRSRRALVFTCIAEVGIPLSLREVVRRAARLDGHRGLRPDDVRGAIRQHQMARPAVVLWLERLAGGQFVAVTDIPWPSDHAGPIRKGDVVSPPAPSIADGRPSLYRAVRTPDVLSGGE